MEVSIGKAGVHLAAASLEMNGVSASIVEQQGFDIVAIYKGEIFTVECKATSKMHHQKYPFLTVRGSKKEKIDGNQCDIVALVDVVGRRVFYMPAFEVVHIKTSLYSHQFTDEYLLFTNSVKKVKEYKNA